MDLLLIVRDALASSLVGNLVVATNAKKKGSDVAVLITQEALAAVTRGCFEWPRELAGQKTRLLLADRGKQTGLPIAGKGEGRQLDVKGALAQAVEAGVVLYACPIWSSLLDLEGKLPDGMRTLDRDALSRLIQGAKQVIGAL